MPNALVDESKLRVTAGTQATLDEKQAESQLSSSQAALLGAQGLFLTQEYTLKNLLSDRLSEWEGVSIKPTEKLVVTPSDFNLPLSWSRGLSQRCDLLQARENIARQGVVLKYLRNQIYPELDLIGSYAFTGAGAAYGDALDGVQKANSPSWTFGAQLVLPLEGNRTARETYRSNKAQKRSRPWCNSSNWNKTSWCRFPFQRNRQKPGLRKWIATARPGCLPKPRWKPNKRSWITAGAQVLWWLNSSAI